MYITAGFFNLLLKQFKDVETDIPELFTEFKTDIKTLESPLSKIDAGILGRYLELVVVQKENHRIGLETGFLLPFVVTGSVFNVWREYTTVSGLFSDAFDFTHLTDTDIHKQRTREDDIFFYFELIPDRNFSELYPVAARQWMEMQYGIALQYAYSISGRYIYPVSVHSPYPQEGSSDKLKEYLSCPVLFGQDSITMIFNKAVLDLPIITPNRDLLPIFEDYMNEIRSLEEQRDVWSSTVRRHLIHRLSSSDLSLDIVANRFNVSKRSLHRKLKEEGTSYQQILDHLRMELSRKYLKQKIPFTEIAFLLGFESQSAFNKFFRKHFHSKPGVFSK